MIWLHAVNFKWSINRNILEKCPLLYYSLTWPCDFLQALHGITIESNLKMETLSSTPLLCSSPTWASKLLRGRRKRTKVGCWKSTTFFLNIIVINYLYKLYIYIVFIYFILINNFVHTFSYIFQTYISIYFIM